MNDTLINEWTVILRRGRNLLQINKQVLEDTPLSPNPGSMAHSQSRGHGDLGGHTSQRAFHHQQQFLEQLESFTSIIRSPAAVTSRDPLFSESLLPMLAGFLIWRINPCCLDHRTLPLLPSLDSKILKGWDCVIWCSLCLLHCIF